MVMPSDLSSTGMPGTTVEPEGPSDAGSYPE